VAAGAEEPFLQDEGGLVEVGGGVDALDFVFVVDLVAFDMQAGADELVDAVGEAVFAVGGGGSEGAQGGEDGLRLHHVSADVEFADVAHGGGGFARFDDVDDTAVSVPNDSAIGIGVVGNGR
jgi:nitrous oxide reductase accessory protein NosL